MATNARHESAPALLAAGPFLGSAPSGLRLDLALDSTGTVEEPFICIDDRGRFSRILLGRIAIGEEATLQHFALKMQRDFYANPTEEPFYNTDIDEMWEREQRDLSMAQGPGVVPTLPFEGLLHSLPIFYCRKVKKYFHPPCPETGSALSVCRDDQLLRKLGLKSYSASLVRYLHCAPQTKGDRGRVFYKRLRMLEESPVEGVTLRYGNELVRDWVPMVTAKAKPEVKPEPRLAFPCSTCPHRESCFPDDPSHDKRIPAEDQIVALSYYDFRCLAMRPLDLRYDELCQILGGGDWQTVAREACGAGSQGRQHMLERLDRHYAGRIQWLYEQDHSGRFGLEVLRLKLAAFQAICEGLAHIHSKCNRAHFDINPGNVMVRVSEPGYAVPARWCFDVRLIDLGSPRRLHPNDASVADMPDILFPGPSADRLHIPPWIARQEGERSFNTVELREVVEANKGVRMTLEAPRIRDIKVSDYRAGDSVRIMPKSSTEHWVWARIVATKEQAVEMTAEVPATHAFRSWTAPKRFDANLTFYHSYGPDYDLYGLGILLFRTLLVNDVKNEFDVERLITNSIRKIEVKLQEESGVIDTAQVRKQILSVIRSDKAAEFDRRSIFHRRPDRIMPLLGITDELWNDVLVFAFRLVTNFAMFSFARAVSPAGVAQHKMALVLEELQDLIRRIDVELFAEDLRSREISGLCDIMRGELRARMAARAPSPGDSGTGNKAGTK